MTDEPAASFDPSASPSPSLGQSQQADPAGTRTRMGREIAEQPAALQATLDALLPMRTDIAHLAEGRRRVLFVARGSSDNAGTYGRYLLEAHSGVSAAMAAPSIATHYGTRHDLSDALVVCVSQSGATLEIVETQAWAAACGAATIAVTNVEGSPLAADADLALVTRAGPELAVPATKTYTTQLAAMAVLATALAPETTALDEQLRLVPAAVQQLVEQRGGVDEAAEALAQSETVLVTGRGLLLGTAQETALKMEEVCLRAVRGYSYADLRHGPISIVTGGVMAVLVAAQDGPLVAAMTELAGDLRSRGARTVGIGGDEAFAAACDLLVEGPDLTEAVTPIATVVPSQLVVEQMAMVLGLDPDAPRGLAKVTQTEADS